MWIRNWSFHNIYTITLLTKNIGVAKSAKILPQTPKIELVSLSLSLYTIAGFPQRFCSATMWYSLCSLMFSLVSKKKKKDIAIVSVGEVERDRETERKTE